MASLTDYVIAATEWLRATPLTDLALGVQKTWLSTHIDGNFWATPTIQVIHILAIASVFSSVLMINLRIAGLAGRSRDMGQTVARYLPWVWWGLVVLLCSGIGLIFSDPVRNLTNPIFFTKMILIIVAAIISLWFQGSVRRNAARWERSHEGRVLIRAGAGAVIVLWCLIMIAGRWIAYAPT
jgi:uncharacterized membrane protein SirB2